MWTPITGKYGLPIRHVDFPQWEIHAGTQGSRFELRNTATNTRAPLFKDNPNANLHTVMDTVDAAIRANEFIKQIEDETL